MPLAVNLLIQNSSTLNQAAYTTASFTPTTPNSLLLLIVGYSVASGAAPVPVVTSSAEGVTWNDLQTAGAVRSISTFRRQTSANPVAQTVTITAPTGTYTSAMWFVVEITGQDTSGTNGSGAITQTNVGNGTGTASSVSLAAVPASDSATLFAQIHPFQEAVNPRTNWTEIGVEETETAPTSTTFAEYRLNGGEQTASATWTTSGAWRGIIMEIKAASGTPPAAFAGWGIPI